MPPCAPSRNTPTLTADDRTFVARLGDAELSDVDFRALLEAHRAGRLDNARLREISGLDTLGASALLRRLRDRGLLTLHAAGAASFYDLGPKAQGSAHGRGSGADARGSGADARGSGADARGSGADARGSGADAQVVGPYTRGFDADAQGSSANESPSLIALTDALTDELRSAIKVLGPRPAAQRLRAVILDVCSLGWWTPRELAAIVGLKDAANLSRKHLGPLVEEGKLERRFPDTPAHPRQAYRAVASPGQE